MKDSWRRNVLVHGHMLLYIHGRLLAFLSSHQRFTFRITNTSFAGGSLGCGAICAGQHCGLGGAGGETMSHHAHAWCPAPSHPG